MERIKFSDLVNIQTRVKENEKVAKSYKKLMEDGVSFPNIVVFVDETEGQKVMYLADGYHRVSAYIMMGIGFIEENKIDWMKGTKSDAIKYNIENNAKKGLAMTSMDKRNAICIILRDNHMNSLSDRAIAQMVGTDHKTVGKYRKMILDGIDPMYQQKKKEGGSGDDKKDEPKQEEILQQLVATLQKENADLKDKNRILTNKAKKLTDNLASCTIQGKLNRNVLTKLIHPDRFTQALKDHPELLADLTTALGAINSVK